MNINNEWHEMKKDHIPPSESQEKPDRYYEVSKDFLQSTKQQKKKKEHRGTNSSKG